MASIFDALAHALSTAFGMTWEILWALILGFAISGVIQAVVSRKQMSKLLPNDKPKTLAIAAGLGAASSSCSYAAVALARSLVKKGGNFTAAMAFEVASTNLVIELGIVMMIVLGWKFTLAEFIGGPLMIVALAILFRQFLKPKMLAAAIKQAQKGVAGKMEGHATMDDMSVKGKAPIWHKLRSSEGMTATSHFYMMDWASIWVDLLIGLLLAGAVVAWVPQSFFQTLFLTSHPLLSAIWGPLIGPIIAVLSFVCSVSNVLLAAALWKGGISFGGVIAFIFADLIVFPILRIYKRYYGLKMASFLFISFYAAMTLAGYLLEILFWLLGITPTARSAKIEDIGISLNYTTIFNIIFLVISAALVWRFLRTGGPHMLKMMNDPKTEDVQSMHQH